MTAAEAIITAFLGLGGAFALIGSFGLLKLDNTMARLHAPTKSATVGVGSVLIASMLHGFLIEGQVSWQELLVTLFLILSAPVSANFLAKTHMHRRRLEADLPPTGVNRRWATFEPDRPAAGDAPPAPPEP
jgi:multicomponent K+:H+ antiporter subunit G